MNDRSTTNHGRHDAKRLPTRFVSTEHPSELMLMLEDLDRVVGGIVNTGPQPVTWRHDSRD